MHDDWPPDLSDTFDPAVHLHSQCIASDNHIPSAYSDDFAVAQEQNIETLAQKSTSGVVIQHCSWTPGQASFSDDSLPYITPSKPPGRPAAIEFGSSPPQISSMAVLDVQAPTYHESPNKRRKIEDVRKPLQAITNNARRKIGFLDDESDDELDAREDNTCLVHKEPLNHRSSQEIVVLPEDIDTSEQQDALLEVLSKPTNEQDPITEHVDKHVTERATSALVIADTFAGRKRYIIERPKQENLSYEKIVAQRSVTEQDRATKAFYGINIHNLMEDIALENATAQAKETISNAAVVRSVEQRSPLSSGKKQNGITKLWTEKYRAKKFTDLVGDERTHRSVLHWIKAWDSIVFPGTAKKTIKTRKPWEEDEVSKHRKVLLLTGPPGLGKTTLAHVCAKQCGYEVQEINASDERSRDIVKGRIRDMVGTENVKGILSTTSDGKRIRKSGKPVCVVVDEVDGVTGGSGAGGEGGFVKALIDLLLLDQKNSSGNAENRQGKKRDRFRLLRPLILVCNDVYHPSLRPLRQSSYAEIIHVRKPPLSMVICRMQSIFEKEGVNCELDGVRRRCEATWGVGSKKEVFGSGTVEGDIRSILVIGEWVASRYRSSTIIDPELRINKAWIERNILSEVSYGGGASRSLGRGGAKEVVDRVFKEGAGFPKTADSGVTKAIKSTGSIGVTEAAKQRASNRLREMIDASGEHDKIVTDCFSVYPDNPMQDDNFLTKPTEAYEWLNWHDLLSTNLFSSQEWELAPYMSVATLAFHSLFATSMPGHARSNKERQQQQKELDEAAPYTGPSAPFQVREGLKHNTAGLSSLQCNLSLPLSRMYRSKEAIATELLPYVLRFLAPDVKPVLINTSSAKGERSAPTASVRRQDEKDKVSRAVECMAATGVRFDRCRVEDDKFSNSGWVYRMEPSLDGLASFSTMENKTDGVRYAVRSVLEAEWQRSVGKKSSTSGVAEKKAKKEKDDIEALKEHAKLPKDNTKKDFFGRIVKEDISTTGITKKTEPMSDANRVWVSYHEGYSNAVRRPITLDELMRGL